MTPAESRELREAIAELHAFIDAIPARVRRGRSSVSRVRNQGGTQYHADERFLDDVMQFMARVSVHMETSILTPKKLQLRLSRGVADTVRAAQPAVKAALTAAIAAYVEAKQQEQQEQQENPE